MNGVGMRFMPAHLTGNKRGNRKIMIELDYKPHGVCARNIHLELSDDGATVLGCEFTGGCNGNLKAISKLVEGMPSERVVEILAGNTCGPRQTSCADQLSQAITEAAENAKA